MYLNITTLQRTSESEIRSAFQNTSFPQPFSPPDNYAVLFATPQPTHDPITQMVIEATPVLTDKGHWEQVWEVVALDAETVTANQLAKAERDRESFKASRIATVDNIKVTTAAGNTFDGDEVDQARMDRAARLLEAGFAPTVNWVLADNTVIQATAAELIEALALAGAEQARLWVLQ